MDIHNIMRGCSHACELVIIMQTALAQSQREMHMQQDSCGCKLMSLVGILAEVGQRVDCYSSMHAGMHDNRQCLRPGLRLQTALQCFTAMGAVKNLPEEVQWSIRALLSRGVPAAAPAAPAAAPPLSFPGLPQVLLQLMGNMNGKVGHIFDDRLDLEHQRLVSSVVLSRPDSCQPIAIWQYRCDKGQI